MIFQIETFFHSISATFSYVVHAGPKTECAIIDAVLDFNPNTLRTSTESADEMAAFIKDNNLQVQWILETHIHADHLSAAQYLKQLFGGSAKIAASKAIETPCKTFSSLFNLSEPELLLAHFDHLFEDAETFQIGELCARALHVPGHTPADLAYQIEDAAVFVGDTLFAPDLGTARCDFPGGSAAQLFHSINRLLSLPPETLLYLCHDYPDNKRNLQNRFSIAQQRAENIHIKSGTEESTFVAMRRKRDATLSLPQLMMPAIQVNILGGVLPKAEENGVSYFKLPINMF